MLQFIHKRTHLVIIVLAAILLEIISGVQYYYSHSMLEDELEQKAEMELRMKAIIVISSRSHVESALRNHIWDMISNLESPDSMFRVAESLIEYNPHLAGGGIAFVPGFYPRMGRLFEPYAYRENGEIVSMQLAGPGHDYTQMEFFKNAIEANEDHWSRPDLDVTTTRKKLITYSLPIHDETKNIVAVLGMDIDTEWLGDTLNRRHIFPSSFNVLLDPEGELIAGPREDSVSRETVANIVRIINDSTIEKRQNKSRHCSIAEFHDPVRNEKGYVFFSPMKGKMHWQIAVVCYDGEVYGKLRTMRMYMVLLMLVAFVLLGFIIQRFARNDKNLQQTRMEKESIDSELRIAKNIQMEMLPETYPPYPERNDFDVCVGLLPAREVGGDIYDFFIRDEKLFFCVGDVSGKGVPSAMVMAVTHSLFRSACAHDHHPARIMKSINETCCDGNKSNMFVTLFIGILDLPTGRLRYCNAGHDIPVLIEDGSCRMLPAKANMPVGLFEDFMYEAEQTQLRPGSTIFLYTDGVTEAKNTQRKQYGMENLLETLKSNSQALPKEMLEKVAESVHTFAVGAEQSDDLTMLAIRYTPQNENDVLNETLVLKNDVRQIKQLSEFVKSVHQRLQLDSSLATNIRLAVEEAVVNVMDYAYPMNTEGEIHITVKANNKRLKYIISDEGVAFNPTEAAKADTTLSAEERPIGGLGILLVRELMDSINYERIDGKNILTLKKNIK